MPRQTPKQHAAIRPLLESTMGVAPADRAAKSHIVEGFISTFLETQKSITPADVNALVHQILNKLIFDREVTWEYAVSFASTQSSIVGLGVITQLLGSSLYGIANWAMIDSVREKAQAFRNEYKELIRSKPALMSQLPADSECLPSESCVTQAAFGIFDAMYAAGGLSVPSAIVTGLGLLFSTHASNPFAGPLKSGDELQFYWENLRYFPPVVGFPTWSTRPTCAGKTAEETAAIGNTQACPIGGNESYGFPKVNQFVGGTRDVPVLALAQWDPLKWGADASEFKLRDVHDYAAFSLGFAEGAVDNSTNGGKNNRVCPGKDAALLIGSKFFELFQKSHWMAKSASTIELLRYGPKWIKNLELCKPVRTYKYWLVGTWAFPGEYVYECP